MDWNLIVSFATLVLLGAGSVVLFVAKAGLEAGAKKGAEAAIAKINWPTELARAIENARGVERQELRFTSYSDLWSRLRPLAIYDDKAVNKASAGILSTNLSDWYFSQSGGLFLTTQARDFYFALQDLLQAVGSTSYDWAAPRPAGGGHPSVFGGILDRMKLNDAKAVLDYLKGTDVLRSWSEEAPLRATHWRTDVKTLAERWSDIKESERFAVLQQVGSILRTSLANDVESRLR